MLLTRNGGGHDQETFTGVGVSPSDYANDEIAYYPGYEYSDLELSDDIQKDLQTRLRVNYYAKTPVLPIDDENVHPNENVEGLLIQYSNGHSIACDKETPMGHPEMFPFLRAIITDHCATIHIIVKIGAFGRVMLQTIRARDMQEGGAYYDILGRLMMSRPLDVSDVRPTKKKQAVAQAHLLRMNDVDKLPRPSVAAAAAGGACSPKRRVVYSPMKRHRSKGSYK
jgi:hypothetical protein